MATLLPQKNWLAIARPSAHTLPSAALAAKRISPAVNTPSSEPASVAERSPARWFAEEVRPHEPSLRAYLRSRFPCVHDLDDLIQETYARLLQAHRVHPVTSTKSFLFATARNAALDIFRRQQIVSIEGMADIHRLSVLEDRPDAAEIVSHKQEIQLLLDAIRALPTRCRQVLTLHKIYGYTHKEIAAEMGISENTVNHQLTIGYERCRQFLVAWGVRGLGK